MLKLISLALLLAAFDHAQGGHPNRWYPAALALPSGLEWVEEVNGNVPERAVSNGKHHGGQYFVGQGVYFHEQHHHHDHDHHHDHKYPRQSWIPGTFAPSLGGTFIVADNHVWYEPRYLVLTIEEDTKLKLRWENVHSHSHYHRYHRNGVPANAVPGGYDEDDKEVYYIGRLEHDHEHHHHGHGHHDYEHVIGKVSQDGKKFCYPDRLSEHGHVRCKTWGHGYEILTYYYDDEYFDSDESHEH